MRPAIARVAAPLEAVIAAACGGGATAADASTTSPCGARTMSSTNYTHVIWIWIENHNYDEIVGSPEAPYINGLAGECGLATNYHNVSHPSLPNYIFRRIFQGHRIKSSSRRQDSNLRPPGPQPASSASCGCSYAHSTGHLDLSVRLSFAQFGPQIGPQVNRGRCRLREPPEGGLGSSGDYLSWRSSRPDRLRVLVSWR